MTKKENRYRNFIGDEEIFTEEIVFSGVLGQQENQIEQTISLSDITSTFENYGEWKELIGFLKGKNLNPKLVKKYIEAVLEIQKSVD